MNTHSSVLYFTLVCSAFTADATTKLTERVSGPTEPKVSMARKPFCHTMSNKPRESESQLILLAPLLYMA